MNELKPCPFCGGKAEFLTNIVHCTIQVQCKMCGIKTRVIPLDLFGKEYATAKWNRRINNEHID